MTAPPRPVPLAKQAIDRFLAFHAELVEVKRLADAMIATEDESTAAKDAPAPDAELQTSGMQAPGMLAPEAAESVAPGPGGVTMVDLFLRLRVAICPNGTPAPSTDGRPDITYVMAAMADEAMLHQVDWPGREQWMAILLEQSLFSTRVAGEEIFDLGRGIIDGAIIGRTDLAAAILLALSLGFRGRYRGIPDKGAINEMRRQLYEHVYNQPPPSGNTVLRTMLPSALLPVLEETSIQKLPRLMPWFLGIAAAVGFWMVSSAMIWNHSTRPVLEMADQVRMLTLSVTDGRKP